MFHGYVESGPCSEAVFTGVNNLDNFAELEAYTSVYGLVLYC